mgnify:CR=1 FL=1
MEISLNAYGKINLGLDVVRRREDGYHEVKMIMQTVKLHDGLIFCDTDADAIEIETNSADIPVTEDNIIYKACELMRRTYGITKGVSVKLDKQIPVAAGMAGGSTDAAAALVAMNRLFDLNLTEEKLMELGVKIGADVPYCVMQGTALSEGIGEVLTAVSPMPDCYIAIAKPPVGVSTKWVYQNLKVSELERHPDIDGMVDALKSGDLRGVADRMENVLETVTIPEHPEIEKIKNIMKDRGALNSIMSGSGPTVFGIFEDKDMAQDAVQCLRDMGLVQQACVVEPYNRER